jgi:hypothetical protein
MTAPRREFQLPDEDEDFLNDRQYDWETVVDEESQWLMIHGWTLPPGYSESGVSVALLVPPSYPDGQIDMMYLRPAVARLDGKAIGALADQPIRGETWQRWSRHRTAENPWIMGTDNVSSHLTLVDDWFKREFERNP